MLQDRLTRFIPRQHRCCGNTLSLWAVGSLALGPSGSNTGAHSAHSLSLLSGISGHHRLPQEPLCGAGCEPQEGRAADRAVGMQPGPVAAARCRGSPQGLCRPSCQSTAYPVFKVPQSPSPLDILGATRHLAQQNPSPSPNQDLTSPCGLIPLHP